MRSTLSWCLAPVTAALCFASASVHAAPRFATGGDGQQATASGETPRIEIMRVPDGGIQPQAVVSPDGVIHLLSYRGEPAGGDLFYTKRSRHDAWSKPLRVNSQPASAVAIGNVRGGQIALGRDGAVHVAWNGSDQAVPQGPEGSSPMLYARLPPKAEAFEPQRNLMTASSELDGGGSVAADPKGHVYVVWHGLPLDAKEKSETGRRVFIAASADDGATFASEVARSDAAAGACGCCGLRAGALPSGELLVLYRAAGQRIHRDMHLMRSTDYGKSFTETTLDAWELNACPMTTASIVPAGGSVALAWESKERVHCSLAPEGAMSEIRTLGDKARYPSLAVDGAGNTLLAWTEGMRWNTGGRLRGAVFDRSGKPFHDAAVSVDGVPVWSLVAAVAKPEGGFIVFY